VQLTPGGRSSEESAAQDADLRLLRAYEPVILYTEGELFLPTAVAPYVAQCSLWATTPGGEATLIVPAGKLTLGRLSRDGAAHRGRPLFLRFVQRPFGRAEYRRWRRQPRARLAATGRFTTTGVFGRLIDAGMRASLLLRGTVPSGLAAAAESTYREHLDADRFTYYGRVVREGGYVCLQYWFFYAMNDWRSTFAGINDHEGDWEMVTIYLPSRSDAPARPVWVAFSSHDYTGDDLRRRWDDPQLRREGDHVVVFAGAGSHSGAFVAGDYVVLVNPTKIQPLISLLRKLARLLAPWRHYTGSSPGLGIPFVDYARGDGTAIGPSHLAQWHAVLIDDETPWVRDYRGLWGLDTRDRFGGERAPSGPRYERDGSVRTAWANPLGWAGLQKVAPEDDVAERLGARVAALDRELIDLGLEIDAERAELRALRAEARSLRTYDFARELAKGRETELAEREAALNRTIAGRTSKAEERRAHLATLSGSIAPDAPQAHVHRPHEPYKQQQLRRTRFLALWAAVSTPLVLGSIIVVLVASPLVWTIDIVVLVFAFIGVEAIARRRFLSFVASTILLALALVLVAGFFLLVVTHWRLAVSLLCGGAALALLLANLGAMRRV